MTTLLPATGYEGKLDIPYKTFADKYFLFLSVNGIQFYLYVTQTAIADGLLVIFEYTECVTWIRSNSDTFFASCTCSTQSRTAIRRRIPMLLCLPSSRQVSLRPDMGES